jgi:deazaflavin-dependent oxidoreductase (nitroreductase family)
MAHEQRTSGAPPRQQSRFAHTMQGLVTRTHRAVYQWSGGLLGEYMGPMRALLLTTTGRKSGQPRAIPLGYFRDGENLALIASNWGRPNPPAWWLNLQAHPVAEVLVGRRRLGVRARQADAEEQTRLWQRAVRSYPPYARYQQGIERAIPVVILEPIR